MLKVDKGLWIFIMVLFTVLGLGALVLAWLQPISIAERIFTSFAGIVGPSWVIVHTLSRRSAGAKN